MTCGSLTAGTAACAAFPKLVDGAHAPGSFKLGALCCGLHLLTAALRLAQQGLDPP